MINQDDFDMTIGKLDFVLSKLMLFARSIADGELTEPNKQTLKHHAEDMEAAAKAIYRKLGQKEEK